MILGVERLASGCHAVVAEQTTKKMSLHKDSSSTSLSTITAADGEVEVLLDCSHQDPPRVEAIIAVTEDEGLCQSNNVVQVLRSNDPTEEQSLTRSMAGLLCQEHYHPQPHQMTNYEEKQHEAPRVVRLTKENLDQLIGTKNSNATRDAGFSRVVEFPTTTTTARSQEERSHDHQKKAVRFSVVNVREYPIIVGDNPACLSGGPPITIAWEILSCTEFSIDKYEEKNSSYCRKSYDAMKLGPAYRDRLLRDLGFSLRERLQGIKAANIIKHERRSTVSFLYASPLHEKLELARKNARNLLSRGKLKQQEREFLQRWAPAQKPRSYK